MKVIKVTLKKLTIIIEDSPFFYKMTHEIVRRGGETD